MRHIRFVTFLALALVASTAVAADGPTRINLALGTKLSAIALNGAASTRTISLNSLEGYTHAAVFIDYTNSAATAVTMTCSARYDSTDSTDYQLHACDGSTTPTLTCGPKVWSNAVSGDEAWVWHVPLLAQNLVCVLAGTSAGAGDLVTVRVRQGVL